ncbi:MAG TPA: SAM-dependent chlorinase/fluorinase [Pyrinomonadaceae bacterium]|jgi:S-adenosylmethionine hydrolase
MVIIALLTDFGNRDYFVGAMKGVILSINENVHLIDITHEIEPQNIKSASFNLRACYKNFTVGTIFVAVVDPGVGSARRAILVETEDYFFIAPDNGLLGFVFEGTVDFRVFELTDERFFAGEISRTFHGRDVFAPVAAHLSNGVAADEFGAQIEDFVRFEENAPRKISEAEIEAEIIETDRFGNLITNLKREDLPEEFTLLIGETRIEKLKSYFAESARGEIFMIFGSAGYLEIAVFKDSAKNLLHAETGQKILVKTVKSL